MAQENGKTPEGRAVVKLVCRSEDLVGMANHLQDELKEKNSLLFLGQSRDDSDSSPREEPPKSGEFDLIHRNITYSTAVMEMALEFIVKL